jgi:hypothetical protein
MKGERERRSGRGRKIAVEASGNVGEEGSEYEEEGRLRT